MSMARLCWGRLRVPDPGHLLPRCPPRRGHLVDVLLHGTRVPVGDLARDGLAGLGYDGAGRRVGRIRAGAVVTEEAMAAVYGGPDATQSPATRSVPPTGSTSPSPIGSGPRPVGYPRPCPVPSGTPRSARSSTPRRRAGSR